MNSLHCIAAGVFLLGGFSEESDSVRIQSLNYNFQQFSHVAFLICVMHRCQSIYHDDACTIDKQCVHDRLSVDSQSFL